MSAAPSSRVRRPWLLRLYPATWRRRYGDEVAEMLAGRAFSFRTSVDLVAGAIDVWLHPSATLAAAKAAQPTEEEKSMLNRIARLDCASPGVSAEDQRKAMVVTLGGTVILTLAWMMARVRLGNNTYIESMSVIAFLIPLLFSMRYTQLKGRPRAVQAIFIAGMSVLVTAIMLASAWVAAQI